jgi:hypothetical protein
MFMKENPTQRKQSELAALSHCYWEPMLRYQQQRAQLRKLPLLPHSFLQRALPLVASAGLIFLSVQPALIHIASAENTDVSATQNSDKDCETWIQTTEGPIYDCNHKKELIADNPDDPLKSMIKRLDQDVTSNKQNFKKPSPFLAEETADNERVDQASPPAIETPKTISETKTESVKETPDLKPIALSKTDQDNLKSTASAQSYDSEPETTPQTPVKKTSKKIKKRKKAQANSTTLASSSVSTSISPTVASTKPPKNPYSAEDASQWPQNPASMVMMHMVGILRWVFQVP